MGWILIEAALLAFAYWVVAIVVSLRHVSSERGRDIHRWDGVATDRPGVGVQPVMWIGLWLAMNAVLFVVIL